MNKPTNSKTKGGNGKGFNSKNLIKSPSDTTLYTPALKQVLETNLVSPVMKGRVLEEELSQDIESSIAQKINEGKPLGETDNTTKFAKDLTTQIIQFIEGIRFGETSKEFNQQRDEQPTNSASQEGRSKAGNLILDAEHFRATINSPPGNSELRNLPAHSDSVRLQPVNLAGERDPVDVDDEFFHVTCHVDSTLKQKIEGGTSLIWKNSFRK